MNWKQYLFITIVTIVIPGLTAWWSLKRRGSFWMIVGTGCASVASLAAALGAAWVLLPPAWRGVLWVLNLLGDTP